MAADEIDRLADLAMSTIQDGATFRESLTYPLMAILVSPRFLFRIEPRPPDVAPDGATDAAPDVTPDTPPDVAPDAAPDSASDAGPDAASDATPDTG